MFPTKLIAYYSVLIILSQASDDCTLKTPGFCKGGIDMRFQNESYEDLLATMSDDDTNEFTFISYSKPSSPSFFDARRKWRFCESIRQIKHQGTCGTSWAFATAMVTTDRSCIASKGKKLFNVSEQDLLTCCDMCYPNDDIENPCTTVSNLISPLLYMKYEGVVTGECKKYNTKTLNDGCKESCDSDKISDEKVKILNILVGTRKKSTVKDMKAEIMKNGPIASILHGVPRDFHLKLGKKVYINTEKNVNKNRGHAIRIVGWGRIGKVPFWICANSWGTKWGNGGFFRIRQGTNELGIEEFFIAPNLHVGKKQLLDDDAIFNPAGGIWTRDSQVSVHARNAKTVHLYKITAILLIIFRL